MKKIIRIIIKKYFGIDGITLFVKKQKKRLMKKVYKKKYTADDLVAVLYQMGMKRGSVVFIHSSMTEFYNYTGTAIEFIDKIIAVIGLEGTLMMPAYPPKKQKLYKTAMETNEIVFDVNLTPSGAGYLSEVFRTYPGVKRSINLQHSVCAFGKLADFFVNEHHLSEVAWDKFSPYFKLGQVDGLIFSIGLEPYLRNVTMIHCTETTLRHKYEYFDSFFGIQFTYKYLDKDKIEGSHNIVIPTKGGVISSRIVKDYFDKSKFKRIKISNLDIEMIESSYMYKLSFELAEKGLSIYSRPSSRGYIKDSVFIKKHETKN